VHSDAPIEACDLHVSSPPFLPCSVGIAARLGIRIANLMRPMDLLYSGKGLKTLTGLTNVSSDMPTLKDRLLDYTTKLEVSLCEGHGIVVFFSKHCCRLNLRHLRCIRGARHLDARRNGSGCFCLAEATVAALCSVLLQNSSYHLSHTIPITFCSTCTTECTLGSKATEHFLTIMVSVRYGGCREPPMCSKASAPDNDKDYVHPPGKQFSSNQRHS
jgi:hypothetical protein